MRPRNSDGEDREETSSERRRRRRKIDKIVKRQPSEGGLDVTPSSQS
jgi:hypothetical protein